MLPELLQFQLGRAQRGSSLMEKGTGLQEQSWCWQQDQAGPILVPLGQGTDGGGRQSDTCAVPDLPAAGLGPHPGGVFADT